MPRKARPTLPIAAPQDQGYGQRGDQMAAQHAIPLPDNHALPAAAPAPAPQADLASALSAAQAMPAPTGTLDAPTSNPAEPFTSGLSTGPGPGPETLGMPIDPVLDYLRAAYGQFQTDEIAQLIEQAGG